MHMKRTFPWAQLGYIHRRLRSALVRHGEIGKYTRCNTLANQHDHVAEGQSFLPLHTDPLAMPSVALTPPLRFGVVAFPPPATDADSESSCGDFTRVTSFSECLYRGAYPKPRNLRFLETLHLRTIVSLTPKPIDDDPAIIQWAHAQNGGAGIRMVHVRTEKPKEETGGLTREGAARAMLELVNRENLPLYVHCLDGIEVTSTLIACLRKIQAWSDTALRAELARGANAVSNRVAGAPQAAPKHLSQFVDRYGKDGVLLPQRDRIPQWLWPRATWPMSSLASPEGMQSMTIVHPTLQIHFERSESYIASQQARFGAVWSMFSHNRSRTPSSAGMSDLSDPREELRSHSKTSPPAPTMHRDSSEMGPQLQADTRRHWDSQLLLQHDAESKTSVPWAASNMYGDDLDLRTPRARPRYVDSDVPPLMAGPPETTLRTPREGRPPNGTSLDERTPLVVPRDAHACVGSMTSIGENDTIPPLGLDADASTLMEPPVDDTGADADAEPDDDVDDDDDYEDYDEDPSQVLDALNLEGL